MFGKLIGLIFQIKSLDFSAAGEKLADFVDRSDDFVGLLEQIGTIPESIEHDSTEEKLFSKASDAVLARSFREIGLKSAVLADRGDSADVQAQSKFHQYTLVADAKAFRMSRTAKNQKDFKVAALSGWRKDAEYAVLCSPYFQYPKKESQVYAQALENNVCLFSWEHLVFMIRNGIKESPGLDLSPLWNFGEYLSAEVVVADMKKCFLSRYRSRFLSAVKGRAEDFSSLLGNQIALINRRGNIEKRFWEEEKVKINAYTREEAVAELVKSKKIDDKIRQIDQYVKGLRRD